jgi:hypothetical protein
MIHVLHLVTEEEKPAADHYVCWVEGSQGVFQVAKGVVDEYEAKTKKRPKDIGGLPETEVLRGGVLPESPGGPHQEPRRKRGRPSKQPLPTVLGAPHGAT